MEVTAPYQAALEEVNWIEGPLVGRPVLAFNPQTVITMHGIARAGQASDIRFTDVTDEAGLPSGGAPPTTLAMGDYDGDGEDNLFVSAHLYSVRGGFVTDVTARTPLPLPTGGGSRRSDVR